MTRNGESGAAEAEKRGQVLHFKAPSGDKRSAVAVWFMRRVFKAVVRLGGRPCRGGGGALNVPAPNSPVASLYLLCPDVFISVTGGFIQHRVCDSSSWFVPDGLLVSCQACLSSQSVNTESQSVNIGQTPRLKADDANNKHRASSTKTLVTNTDPSANNKSHLKHLASDQASRSNSISSLNCSLTPSISCISSSAISYVTHSGSQLTDQSAGNHTGSHCTCRTVTTPAAWTPPAACPGAPSRQARPQDRLIQCSGHRHRPPSRVATL